MINTNADSDSGLDDPSSFHPGGANVLFSDGSVHFFKSIPSDAGSQSRWFNSLHAVQPDLSGARHARGGEVVSSDSY